MGLSPVHQLPWPEPTDPADGPAGFQALALATELAIGGPVSSGGALPAAPKDGQVAYYLADAAGGVVWAFRYRAASASAYKWEFVGGYPLDAVVAASEGTGSQVYTDLATVGPSVTAPLAGDYLVTNEAGYLQQSIANTYGYMSFATGAAAATDVESVGIYFPGNSLLPVGRQVKKTGVPAGAIIRQKYRSMTGGGGTVTAGNRRIAITPIRVAG